MRPVLLANGLIFNEGSRFVGSLLISDGRIAEIHNGRLDPSVIDTDNYTVYDCQGKMILPGVIDEHVHFRDPGLTEKGDMLTESRAAVAGGVTSFFDMPNTSPQTTTEEAWEEKMARAAEVSAANYAFFMGVTNENTDLLLRMDPTRVPGAKLFLGSSTGQMLVDSNTALHRLFSSYKGVIAVHAESESVIRANTLRLKKQYGGDIPLALHSELRSRQACVEATRRAVELARQTGARLHVMHLTTADELEFFSPGDVSMKKITAETCPHYLIFTSESVERSGGLTKCNPAIKSAEDRHALLRAVADGRIDSVATDHAPHLSAQKLGNALTASSGMPSVQFSLPLMMQLAKEGHFSYDTVVERMCAAPARIFNVARRGFLRPNYWADIAVVNPDDDYEITRDMVISRCGWTPYEGRRLNFRVEQTWINGILAYDNGTFTEKQTSLPVRFN